MITQYNSHFVAVKPTKSIGVSIILTTLFGPLGLFYASVMGGIIMTLLPVILVVLFFAGLLGGNDILRVIALGLLFLFGITYWLVCIIWGAIAIANYNRRIMEESLQSQHRMHQSVYEQPYERIEQVTTRTESLSTISNSNKPSVSDWMKEHPGKGLNDYYRQFGVE